MLVCWCVGECVGVLLMLVCWGIVEVGLVVYWFSGVWV